MFTLTTKEKMELIEKYKGRSLKDLRPDLAAEWHPMKNGDLTPEMVTAGVNRKVWWLLPYDDIQTGKHFNFEWESHINNRSKGVGCPFLAGKAVWPGFNDLATINPDLAAEWHPTKNGGITPQTVTANSGKKVWWLLSYDDPETGSHFNFEWESVIGERSHGCGCPFLSGRAVWAGFNDLATVNPELASQWHPVKNGKLTPKMVPANSTKCIWWLFAYDDPITGKHFDFEWKATVNSRTQRMGCPYLSGHAVWRGFNDFATTHPQIAKEWHPTKNKNLKPCNVTHGTKKKIWWKCNKGHEWCTTVAHRAHNCGCPHCKTSKGEIRISEFCEKYGVVSNAQYKFIDCIYKRALLFDRAVFNKSGELVFLVEYDGEQHSKPVSFTGKDDALENLKSVQMRDNIKNKYCRENKIPLVRISYKDYDNIEQILLKKMVRYGLLN